jgi:hypothetical protein
MVASPMRFDGQRAVSDLPPPGLDEHGEAMRTALQSKGGWPSVR